MLFGIRGYVHYYGRIFLYLVLDAFDNNAGVFAAQPSEKRWNSHDDFESEKLKVLSVYSVLLAR